MPAVVPITEKPAKAKRESVSFKVDSSVAADLKKLRGRVKERRGKVDFHFDPVLEQALIKVIKQANKALDAFDEREGSGSAESRQTDAFEGES